MNQINENTSSTDISNIMDFENKKLQSMFNTRAVLLQRSHEIAKAILEKRLEKKDIEMSLDKLKHEIDVVKINLKLLTSQFWKSKNSGT